MSGRDDELSVPAAVRREVLERDPVCRMCGQWSDIYHVHHIIYRSQGGPNRPENLIALHWKCHEKVHSNKRLWVPVLQTLVREPPNVTGHQLARWIREQRRPGPLPA